MHSLLANITIVHPCQTFAASAGYASWQDVVTSAKAGQIITGAAPHIGKTVINLKLFSAEVEREGLYMFVDDFGMLALGLKESFPSETLAYVEEQVQRLLAGF